MVLVEVGPTALRVIYLVARRHPLGTSTWVGVALLPVEFAGTAFVDGTVFVFVHLVFGTLFVARWLAGRTLFFERTLFGGTVFFGRTPFERTRFGQTRFERRRFGRSTFE